MKILILQLFLLTPAALMAQQNFDTVKVRAVRITENLYMLKGAGGNVGVFFGKDGTLVIDDQYAPLSNRINGAIKTLDPGEIRFLVNTHIHGDHSGGNDNFKKMGVTVVAHDNVRDRMMKGGVNRQGQPVAPRAPDAWPVISFPDKMSFHLNDDDIELTHLPPGHTDGDVLVHFVKPNVYHTGDSFIRTGYPFIDGTNGGSFTGYISSLEKTLSLLDDNAKIIPGHGNLSTKADVKALHDVLTDIRDQVAAALKQGKKVEDIPALGITDKYEADLGRGFVKGKDFVLIVADAMAKEMPAKQGKKSK